MSAESLYKYADVLYVLYVRTYVHLCAHLYTYERTCIRCGNRMLATYVGAPNILGKINFHFHVFFITHCQFALVNVVLCVCVHQQYMLICVWYIFI